MNLSDDVLKHFLSLWKHERILNVSVGKLSDSLVSSIEKLYENCNPCLIEYFIKKTSNEIQKIHLIFPEEIIINIHKFDMNEKIGELLRMSNEIISSPDNTTLFFLRPDVLNTMPLYNYTSTTIQVNEKNNNKLWKLKQTLQNVEFVQYVEFKTVTDDDLLDDIQCDNAISVHCFVKKDEQLLDLKEIQFFLPKNAYDDETLYIDIIENLRNRIAEL